MTATMSRREVLLRAIQIPAGGVLLLGLGACGGGSGSSSQAALCADPHAMSESENGTRSALNYVEKSSDPQKVCAGCAFFHAGTAAAGGCGTCDMFSGGPVNSEGHCNSWNAKS